MPSLIAEVIDGTLFCALLGGPEKEEPLDSASIPHQGCICETDCRGANDVCRRRIAFLEHLHLEQPWTTEFSRLDPTRSHREIPSELRLFPRAREGRSYPAIYTPDIWPAWTCPRGCDDDGVDLLCANFDWFARCFKPSNDELPGTDICNFTQDLGPLACVYCGAPSLQREHIIPVIYGGTAVVPSCDSCNRTKGNAMPVLEWLVADRLLWTVVAEAKRIKGDLLGVLSLHDALAPKRALELLRKDIAWWEHYVRFVERRPP